MADLFLMGLAGYGAYRADKEQKKAMQSASAPAAEAPPPKAEAPPTMPDAISPAVLDARRRAASVMSQGGRSSTVLSSPATRSTLAGSYSGRRLGAV